MLTAMLSVSCMLLLPFVVDGACDGFLYVVWCFSSVLFFSVNCLYLFFFFFFFSSRRRHTRSYGDWSSDVCSSDLAVAEAAVIPVASTKWSERPLATVVLKPGATASPDDLRAFLAPQFPKFWLQIGRASCRERV